MTEWILIALATLANAAAAALSWRFCRRARAHREDADYCRAASRSAREAARGYAEEARRLAVRDLDNQVLPFTPAEGWHRGEGERFQ